MKRLIDAELLHWKAYVRRKPLIIRGARQIGKTWSVEQFGRAEFKSMVKVDLEKRPELHRIFQGNLEAKQVLQALSVAVAAPIVAGETLLFIDEIQACPRALTALRYFYEETPELHVIAAGSLLEFALGETSFPVGRVQFLNMYPLTFAEFVLAQGNQPLFDLLQQSPADLGEAVHKLALEQLKQYFFIGGMPDAVRALTEGGSMLDAFKAQEEIIEAYREDFFKYAPRVDKGCLNDILSNAAQKAGEQIKYTALAPDYTVRTIHKSFDLLCNARVLHNIPAVKTPSMPLFSTVNRKKFKASVVDIGLMQRLSHVPVHAEIRHDDLLDIYRGKMAEQFVAQELLVTQNRELYYWAREERGSSAEVDFLLQKEGQVYPVEVKSGKGGSLRSLHLMLQAYPQCPEGWVLYSGPYQERPEQKLKFIPLYFAGSIANQSQKFVA